MAAQARKGATRVSDDNLRRMGSHFTPFFYHDGNGAVHHCIRNKIVPILLAPLYGNEQVTLFYFTGIMGNPDHFIFNIIVDFASG